MVKSTGHWFKFALVLLSVCFVTGAQAQRTDSSQATAALPASVVVTKSARAVGFVVGGGSTRLDMVGTDLMPQAAGEAKVEVKRNAGRTAIDLSLTDMNPPARLGAEFLTYVLWVITPEGRTSNTGEVLLNRSGEAKLSATTPAQTFSMVITAEPYFAVRLPSEVVVMRSEVRKDTKGETFPVNEYKLLKRGQYEKLGNPLALSLDPKVPLEMYQARNAVEIARSHGADRYAPDILAKADASLKAAEASAAAGADRKEMTSQARQAVQFAEDARAFSMQRQEEERIVREREAAASKARAEAETKAAAEAAEAKRLAEAKAAEERRFAEVRAADAKRVADAAIARQEEARKLAEQQRQAADQQRLAAEQQRLAAEREKQELRARLLAQFNRALPTTDGPRGLVVNMGDVLFDTGKAELRPPAREALAKLSGIALNYPSLRFAIEGHTDSTGSAEFNQTLSEKRASSVREYLLAQGLPEDALTAQGSGQDNPVADNKMAEGRQKNRRVEIVVSGEVIGSKIGSVQ